ncbi:uncharacterized protein [Saccopteryx bilineata]|uniref:uncharacterized protein isoform X1 n=1 Tax=Saccopteryx bilineata TaxID=59482 RepID=UPI00338D73AF
MQPGHWQNHCPYWATGSSLVPLCKEQASQAGPSLELLGLMDDWRGLDSETPITLAKPRVMLQVAGWIEAFAAPRETADTVVSILVEDIIPQFGLPTTILSDNGPAFTAQIVQQVSTSLNITWKLHIPYHPQSSGPHPRGFSSHS